MVLFLNGVVQEEAPADIKMFYINHPVYRESATQLHSVPPKVVGPGPVGLLCVRQREMAITVPHDKHVTILAGDNVTTCILVFLRHPGSGATGLMHYDGSGTDEGVMSMIARVQELSYGYPEGRLELSLIGAYSSHNYSVELFYSLMVAFHKQAVEIDLVLAVVGELNTIVRNGTHWPILYGAGMNVKTGEIFPATIPDKGPDIALRGARVLTDAGQQILDVYDCSVGLMRIGPFNYNPLRGVDLWLEQSDEFILQHLSTTPDIEPPHFVSMVRAMLKYIRDHPFPAVTVFRDNRPHYYRRDEHTGAWIPLGY
ncbi:unnamed protein product [Bemisia tabaci]|uniref:Protein N-terminal asparagine amidohydrolase n=1 Tax=Bemisia tabaci TaxID=7038 RepID=A0A9P0EWF2_BEMTA|nr:PREDICTED: protein N-terminal asparagine amidohydrolase [Bemisia tabaci]CAH0381972.1 unnamed protein product [Bemisia tabaci]